MTSFVDSHPYTVHLKDETILRFSSVATAVRSARYWLGSKLIVEGKEVPREHVLRAFAVLDCVPGSDGESITRHNLRCEGVVRNALHAFAKGVV